MGTIGHSIRKNVGRAIGRQRIISLLIEQKGELAVVGQLVPLHRSRSVTQLEVKFQ
jgi:hypothetical protein